jgi:hypothetical protein
VNNSPFFTVRFTTSGIVEDLAFNVAIDLSLEIGAAAKADAILLIRKTVKPNKETNFKHFIYYPPLEKI